MGVLATILSESESRWQLMRLSLLYSLLIATTFAVWTLIYRLYLHPLAKFPGPRTAAATHLWEIGYDYFGHGAYLWQTERMHDRYGAVLDQSMNLPVPADISRSRCSR